MSSCSLLSIWLASFAHTRKRRQPDGKGDSTKEGMYSGGNMGREIRVRDVCDVALYRHHTRSLSILSLFPREYEKKHWYKGVVENHVVGISQGMSAR